MPTINNPQDPNSPLFVTRNGRLLTNYDLDLAPGHAYNIDNTPILSLNTLGVTVINSNLRSVGTLNSLEVGGDAIFGGFAFFNSTLARIGIGSEEPAAAIDILENNVEMIMGSPTVNVGTVGTYSNHDLALITDNQTRITVKNSGAVDISGDVNISGTLTVTNIVADSRVDRGHSLQFSPNLDSTVYGLGLVWNATDRSRQFVMMSGPDRLFSTESIDVAEGNSYYINGQQVLSDTQLGASVTASSLTSLGTLNGLAVAGQIKTSTLAFNTNLSVSDAGVDGKSSVGLTLDNAGLFFGSTDHITVGDITAQSRPVRIFGPLSVNVNNPDPTLQFNVDGDVSLGGKRFTNGTSAPVHGTFNMGDICWNMNPSPTSYIGWVCVMPGNPGQWASFGQIASQ
jgi:hypothetical protein